LDLAAMTSPGKDIWMFGGAELLTTFVDKGWIDEYWLSIHPIVLGAGKPLFQNIKARKRLTLIEHKVYETGLVTLRYQPKKISAVLVLCSQTLVLV
jgi:dihydrofolate reductase